MIKLLDNIYLILSLGLSPKSSQHWEETRAVLPILNAFRLFCPDISLVFLSKRRHSPNTKTVSWCRPDKRILCGESRLPPLPPPLPLSNPPSSRNVTDIALPSQHSSVGIRSNYPFNYANFYLKYISPVRKTSYLFIKLSIFSHVGFM